MDFNNVKPAIQKRIVKEVEDNGLMELALLPVGVKHIMELSSTALKEFKKELPLNIFFIENDEKMYIFDEDTLLRKVLGNDKNRLEEFSKSKAQLNKSGTFSNKNIYSKVQEVFKVTEGEILSLEKVGEEEDLIFLINPILNEEVESKITEEAEEISNNEFNSQY